MGGGMSLHLGGVYQTGADALDIGVSDSEIVTNQAGTFVILSSGAAGGLSVYRLLPDGGLALHDMQVFPDALQAGLMPNVAMAEIDGAPVLFVGGTADHCLWIQSATRWRDRRFADGRMARNGGRGGRERARCVAGVGADFSPDRDGVSRAHRHRQPDCGT